MKTLSNNVSSKAYMFYAFNNASCHFCIMTDSVKNALDLRNAVSET